MPYKALKGFKLRGAPPFGKQRQHKSKTKAKAKAKQKQSKSEAKATQKRSKSKPKAKRTTFMVLCARSKERRFTRFLLSLIVTAAAVVIPRRSTR